MNNQEIVIAAAKIKTIFGEKGCLILVRTIAKKRGFTSMAQAIDHVVETAMSKVYAENGKLVKPEVKTEYAENAEVMAVYTYLNNYLSAIWDGNTIDFNKVK